MQGDKLPVVADVRSPVAAVGEAPDCGGFGGEGGGGELREILPVTRFLRFNLQSFRNEFRYPYIMFWK